MENVEHTDQALDSPGEEQEEETQEDHEVGSASLGVGLFTHV